MHAPRDTCSLYAVHYLTAQLYLHGVSFIKLDAASQYYVLLLLKRHLVVIDSIATGRSLYSQLDIKDYRVIHHSFN